MDKKHKFLILFGLLGFVFTVYVSNNISNLKDDEYNFKSDHQLYAYINDEINKVKESDSYEVLELSQKKEKLFVCLKELQDKKLISFLHYNKNNFTFSYQYKNGELGMLELKKDISRTSEMY